MCVCGFVVLQNRRASRPLFATFITTQHYLVYEADSTAFPKTRQLTVSHGISPARTQWSCSSFHAILHAAPDFPLPAPFSSQQN